MNIIFFFFWPGPLSGAKKQTSNHFSSRLLIVGDSCSYIGSALLHHMERLPVHRLDLTTLYGSSARNPEEACVQVFQEARRNVPAIIYLPLVFIDLLHQLMIL